MKRITAVFLTLFLLLTALSLSGCELFDAITGKGDAAKQLFDECTETNGTWVFHDFWTQEKDADTYLTFHGNKGEMTFEYYEDGVLKRDGVYRVVYRGETADVDIPVSIGFEIKGDSKHRDWLDCFVRGFRSDFTQFTVMREERDLGINEVTGTPQARTYRMSEMPFKFGTYVKENCQIKTIEDDRDVSTITVPSGTYISEQNGATFTFMQTYPLFNGSLFRYTYGGNTVEGVYSVGVDRDKLFIWIDYQEGAKPTRQQKQEYEMESGLGFPPNYNIYGSFDARANQSCITISRVTAIEGYGYNPQICSVQTGTYSLQQN